MKPAQAIKTCLAKSFQFKGRVTRSEFWWFAPIGLTPVLITAQFIAWEKFELFGIWRVCLFILMSLPLLATASWRRRASDHFSFHAANPAMGRVSRALLVQPRHRLVWYWDNSRLLGLAHSHSCLPIRTTCELYASWTCHWHVASVFRSTS